MALTVRHVDGVGYPRRRRCQSLVRHQRQRRPSAPPRRYLRQHVAQPITVNIRPASGHRDSQLRPGRWATDLPVLPILYLSGRFASSPFWRVCLVTIVSATLVPATSIWFTWGKTGRRGRYDRVIQAFSDRVPGPPEAGPLWRGSTEPRGHIFLLDEPGSGLAIAGLSPTNHVGYCGAPFISRGCQSSSEV